MIFEANNISVSINKKKLISDFSLSVNSNEFIMITGKSGSGKTTLLNTLSLLDKNYYGNITYLGEKITRKKCKLLRRNIISYMFQNYGLLDNSTVWDNLKLATKYNHDFKKDDLDILLNEFSLPKSILTERIFCLSGGEQQRIALIRTLIKPFKIIFADEPTGNLDDENAKFILSYLKNITISSDKSVIMVTHEKEFLDYASKVIDLNEMVI